MIIGIIGLGNMGRPIAEHLSEIGENLVIWNRTAAKAEGITGSTILKTPRAVAEASDLVISVLANDDALSSAYHGIAGILEADLTGKTIIELCTTSPELL